MLKIIENTKIWFGISLTVIIIGLCFMSFKGLELGIEFKGGSDVKIEFGKAYNKTELDTLVKKYDKEAMTNVLNNTILEVKSNKMSAANISSMFSEIKTKYKLNDTAISQDYIGASFGSEIAKKAILAVVISNILILLYIAKRFEWKFGVAAIIALVHDVLITLSVYAIARIPLDSGFVAAMLTVIGYSMSDTIVVFDRVRENSKLMRKFDVVKLADASISQTIHRSIYTVMTVLITLTSVFVFVPDIRNFSKPLLIGITSGCYSSIFIATPFWVIFKKLSDKKKKQARLGTAK